MPPSQRRSPRLSAATKFVVTVGVISFFADFTYEGSRSITGPYLGMLGAGAFTISVVSGAGEFIGYNIRLFSGRGADRTGRYWPITIAGYILQMSVVPLLAIAGSRQAAAAHRSRRRRVQMSADASPSASYRTVRLASAPVTVSRRHGPSA
jgi:hypothetical protein